MNKKLPLIGLFFLLVISATGIYIRYDNLQGHFTHIDDLLVATNLMKKGRTEQIAEAIRSQDTVAIQRHASSGLFKDLNSVKNSSFLFSCIYHYHNFGERFNRIPKVSTYAPLQCGMTSWLVASEDSGGYESIKRRGRFWSFVFGILSIGGAAFLAFYFYKNEPYAIWLAAFAASIVTFSWENIVYSQQMEPYTIVVFFHCVLLYVLLRYHEFSFTWKQAVFTGLLSAGLAWGQYQMLFCGAAFLTTLLFINRDKKHSLLKSIAMATAYAIVVYPLLSYIRPGGGVNWNAGNQGQFLFSIHQQDSGFALLIYPFKFFFYNTYVTVRAMIGFVPDEFSIVINAFTTAFMVLMTVGVYALFISRKTDAKKRILGVYLVVLVLIWLLLIVASKVTLSPTRHSMVLLPVFILLAVEGISFILRKHIPAVVSALVLIQASAFFIFYPEEKAARTDAFSEQEMEQLMHQYKPGLVISYGFTDNVVLMKTASDFHHAEMHSPDVEVEDYANAQEYYDEKYAAVKNIHPQCLMLISTRSPWQKKFNKAPDQFLGIKLEEYREIWKKEIRSQTQIEYSRLTWNGANDLYVTVLEKK